MPSDIIGIEHSCSAKLSINYTQSIELTADKKLNLRRALHNQEQSTIGMERKLSVSNTGDVILLELVCRSFVLFSEPDHVDPACCPLRTTYGPVING